MEVTEEALAAMFAVLGPHLDERQRRLLAGAQARALGRGGVTTVARASGMSRSTVRIGTSEIDQGPELTGRVRRPGAGRPKAAERNPGLLAALDALVEPTARGDPESGGAVDLQVDPQAGRRADRARVPGQRPHRG